MKKIKVLWLLWFALSIPLLKYKPLGPNIIIYFVLFFTPIFILSAIWAEKIRRLIVADYPDVLSAHPELRKAGSVGTLCTIKADEGDKRLRREVRSFYIFGFFSFLWLFLTM